MSKGGKSAYFLTFQFLSPRLTHQMMISADLEVDEIVSTFDSIGALQYAYVHFPHRTTEQELAKALETLESSESIKGSNIYGYSPIDSSSLNSSELIEDHPGFRILVQHDERKNTQFNRWANVDNLSSNCGYNLLKNKLCAKLVSQQAQTANGGDGGVSRNFATNDDEEDIPRPVPRTAESDGGKNKRRKTEQPQVIGGSGGGMDALSIDFMRSIFEDKSKNDNALFTLKEKVMKLEYEKTTFQTTRECELAQQSYRELTTRYENEHKELTTKYEEERRIVTEEAAVAYNKLEGELQEERSKTTDLIRLKVLVFLSFDVYVHDISLCRMMLKPSWMPRKKTFQMQMRLTQLRSRQWGNG